LRGNRVTSRWSRAKLDGAASSRVLRNGSEA
jgi:hypothetical protein